ncbi:MAG: hypothetical protein IJ580_03940 [Prevotella sp.]|nr:hypothetical protein [Prevotella sp.]
MQATVIDKKISPLQRAKMVAAQKGWGPLTEEEKKALDEIVRMVTNLS